jgi:hypothetical protein
LECMAGSALHRFEGFEPHFLKSSGARKSS